MNTKYSLTFEIQMNREIAMSEYIQDLNDRQTIQRIWEKAIIVEGYNKDMYRQDFAGAWISREAHDDTDNLMGWEIDHIFPIAKGGDNHIDNLRPMNWRNNRSKGDDYPRYTADITSDDNKNIEKQSICTVSTKLQNVLTNLYSK